MGAGWVTALLLLVLGVIAVTNVSSPRKWRLLAQAMFRMRLGRQTLREDINLRDRTLIGLLVVAVLVLALFAWQLFVHMQVPDAPEYPVWLGLVSAGVLFQGVLVRTIGALSQADNGLQEHLYTGLLVLILTGMVLLPVVALVAFRPEWRSELLMVGGVFIGLLLVYRWVRGGWIGWGEGMPVRYIILYICSAEILPVLLLIDAFRQPIPQLFHP